MELRQLECFVAVAEEGHFGRAASKTFLAPSAASQQVIRLESELGVKLFERTTRTVRLTYAGRALFEHAQKVLAEVAEMRRQARLCAEGASGQLVLAYPSSSAAVAMTIIKYCQENCPTLQLLPQVALNFEIARGLADFSFDVGVGNDAESGLASAVIASEPLSLLVCHRSSHLAALASVTVADLQGEQFICCDRTVSPEVHREILGFFQAHGVDATIREYHLTSEAAALDLVSCGYGHAFMKASFVGDARRADLVLRHLDGPCAEFRHLLVWRRDDADSAVIKQFVAMARAAVRELLPWCAVSDGVNGEELAPSPS